MKSNKLKLKIIFTFCIVILFFAFSILHFIKAQTSPQFLVSWQAQNYAVSWYQGKILPIKSTPIDINFELIDNGKVADLSKTKVRWYVNDSLVINENNGLGIKNLEINIPDYNGGQTEIRITVVDYGGGDLIDKLIKIPVVGPEAVINAPYPDAKIKTGPSIFGLFPFFFNVADPNNLSVSWLVNGQKPTGPTDNPYLLNLNIGPETPKDTQINISVSIKNILKQLEFANKSVNLVIK